MPAAVSPQGMAPARTTPATRDVEMPLYELQSANTLPLVDFSISVKSRILNRRQLDVFDRIMRRYRRPLVLGYAIGVAIYPFMFALPFDVSQPVAVGITVLCSVPTISMISTLRYNMVKLMLGTFDFWFCTVAAWSTAVVLSAIVAEAPARAVAIPVAFAGVQANIMIDANLRSARNWVWVNCIGLTAYLFITGWCSFRFIPRQRFFAVIRIGDIDVPAESFVGSGLMTVCALLARNILRKHRAKKHNHPPMEQQVGRQQIFEVVECASYRSMLRYAPYNASSSERNDAPDAVVPFASFGHSREVGGHRIAIKQSYMQQLWHPKSLDVIDPKQTISKTLFSKCIVTSPSVREPPQRLPARTKAVHICGLTLALLSFAVGLPSVEAFIEDTSAREGLKIAPSLQVSLLVATVAYCASFFALYQRLILKKIFKSFNFLFLDLQITVAHVCVCDFFRWSSRRVALITISWVWYHWVFWVDAVSPVVRDRIGFHIRLAAPIFTLCLAAAMGIVYGLIRIESSSTTAAEHFVFFDRVVWSGTVFGQTATFRVVPVFYNCLANAFPLALRLLWRLYTVPNDVLVVLDGVVVFSNYMSKLDARSSSRERSRRWASLRTERE